MLVILAYLGILLAIFLAAYRIREPERVLKFLLRRPKLQWLGNRLCHFLDGLNLLLRAGTGRLLRIALYTALYLVGFYALTPLILAGLGAPQRLGYVVAFQLVLFFTASLAPTPGSTGAVELGAFALFSVLVATALLGAFLVWWRTLTFFSSTLFGAGPFAYFAVSEGWVTAEGSVR